jgi:hypothetical protein
MARNPFRRIVSKFFPPVARPSLDLDRWASLENNEDWNARGRLIQPYLEGHLPLLDVGSGTQFLKSLVGAENYISVDSVGTHGAHYVVDLNSASLPEEALKKARVVTFLGVLEYLDDPEKHLRLALADGRRVIFTYTPTDSVPEKSVRAENGWKSHLSLADLHALLGRLGVEPTTTQRTGAQIILVLGGTELAQAQVIRTPAPTPIKKKKLIISGFFARGNAGDEALLQRIYETFSPKIDLVCTIDRTGAFDGFWDWYPYTKMELIHQGELARVLSDDIVGIHVGGGGLPLGFNAAQNSIAHATRRPVVSTGIDDPLRMLVGHDVDEQVVKNYIESFSAFEVRTPASHEALKGLAPSVGLGADWAFDLPADQTRGEIDFDGITVVVRELPRDALDRQRLAEYKAVFAALAARDIQVRLLPFCPEDERYLDWLQPSWRHTIERHWWNPRRCKELIARSRGLISIGRLHPLIFAAESGTPALAIDIDTERFTHVGATSKIADHAREFSMPYYPSMGAFLADIADGAEIPMASKSQPEYAQRLTSMRRKAFDAFGLS